MDNCSFTIVRNQTISVSGTSAAVSNAFLDGVTAIRVASTTGCHLKIGASPVATTSDMYLPPNWTDFIKVQPGQKIAAIQTSAGGTLHVTEITK